MEEVTSLSQHPVEPHDNDVLCGRGGDINIHPGNIKFRNLVSTNKRVYLTSRFKREKRLIAEKIVNDIKNQTPPGRFLTKDKTAGFWLEISDEKARDKTSQALREGAPKLRQEISNEIERKKLAPKHAQMDWYLRDQRSYDDIYDPSDSYCEYDNRNPQSRYDASCYNRNNILKTFRDRFGCPANLNDVRDDDRTPGFDYEYTPKQDQHYYYNYANDGESPYQDTHWSRHQPHLQPNQLDYHNQMNQDLVSSHKYGPKNQNENGNYVNFVPTSPPEVHRVQEQTHGMWQGLKSMLSWGSDNELDVKRNVPPTPRDLMKSDLRHEEQLSNNFHQDKNNNIPVEKSWTDSFNPCQVFNPFKACQSNLMDVANWTICGDHPESNITSIQSIEIDEPVPSGEMRGSSLVHVFDESAQSDMLFGDAMKLVDESALHDSSLNLYNVPSMDINFSSDRDQPLQVKFSHSDMSL